MRRDYFSVEMRTPDREGAEGPAEPDGPLLAVRYDGPPATLDDRLTDPGTGTDRSPATIDVTYRLHGAIDEADSGGVLAIADRLTGEFLLEANVDAAEVLEFVRAARDRDAEIEGTDRYRVCVPTVGGNTTSYEKSTLLVYTEAGNLLRRHSLIPSGVEL